MPLALSSPSRRLRCVGRQERATRPSVRPEPAPGQAFSAVKRVAAKPAFLSNRGLDILASAMLSSWHNAHRHENKRQTVPA